MEETTTDEMAAEEQKDEHWFDQFLDDYDYERPKRGQVLKGHVLRIDEDAVLVDVGLKRDAIVPGRDLGMLEDEFLETLKEGDEVLVYVLKPPVGDEDLLVSLHKGLEHKNWERAEQYLENEMTLDLEIIGENRGGLLVQFESLRGFVPNSQVPELRRRDRQSAKDIKRQMIGDSLPLKVIEVNRDRRRLILSALAAQEERRQKRLQELEKDQIIFGKVVNIVNFGVFVDLGGIDGLVHISELDWQRVGHPSELFKVGDDIEVQVIEVDVERERVSLSRKALLPSPWQEIDEKYDSGELIEGTVTKVLDFGAFVELPEGVEGLVHVSELGYSTTGAPHDVVKPGERVLVRILDISPNRERISLSMRKVPLEKQISWVVEQEEAAQEAAEEAGSSDTEASVETVEADMAAAEEPVAEASAETVEADTSAAEEPVAEASAETVEADTSAAEEPVAEASAETIEADASVVEEPVAEASAETVEAEETATEPSAEAEAQTPEADSVISTQNAPVEENTEAQVETEVESASTEQYEEETDQPEA